MQNFVTKGRFSFHWFDDSTTVIDALTVAKLGDKKVFIQDKMKRLSNNPQDQRDIPGVSCRTPVYKFALRKNPGANGYFVRYFDPSTTNYENDDRDQFNSWYHRYIDGATHYYGRSFLQRMNDPTFVLKSIENQGPEGANLVRLTYACGGKNATEVGYVDLDLGKNWGITHFNLLSTGKRDGYEAMVVGNLSYREVDSGRFFPSHIESHQHAPQTPEIFQRSVSDLDQIQLGAATPEMFKITAYGLPDIPLRPQSRSSVFTFRNPVLWLALLVTLICFLALWLLRSRRIGRS